MSRDDFNRASAEHWPISADQAVYPLQLPQPVTDDGMLLVQVFCSACRAPVGRIGGPEGTAVLSVEFRCVCGQITSLQSIT